MCIDNLIFDRYTVLSKHIRIGLKLMLKKLYENFNSYTYSRLVDINERSLANETEINYFKLVVLQTSRTHRRSVHTFWGARASPTKI